MKVFFTLIAMVALSTAAAVALAHSGGLNAQGCHAGSRPYHCHRAPPAAPQQPAPTRPAES